MATGVFGVPITDMTLQVLPDWDGREVTRYDRGFAALNMINSENKAVNARTYVDNLKANFGNGVCTKCLIYNATGEPMRYITHRDWFGRIGESFYPTQLANGQWGAYLHTKRPAVASGSCGAAVYRLMGLDAANPELDCMMAWSTAWGPWYNNSCYAEIRGRNHFVGQSTWDAIYRNLSNAGLRHIETRGLFQVELSIGNSTTSVWETIIKLNSPN